MSNEVLEAHPKGTVVTEHRLDVSYNVISPIHLVIVSPSSLPLEGAPRVPDVQQLGSIVLFDLDHRVGMAWNEASLVLGLSCLCELVLTRCRGRYQVSNFIETLQLVEQLSRLDHVLTIAEVEVLCRAPGQVHHTFACEAATEREIIPVNLGISLLK